MNQNFHQALLLNQLLINHKNQPFGSSITNDAEIVKSGLIA